MAELVKIGQACQHRKVKCDLENGQDRCARCTRLGLECVVNKSLQTLLDGENEWKSEMEAKVQTLETALAEVQRVLNMPGRQLPSIVTPKPIQSIPGPALSPSLPRMVTAMTRENSIEPTAQESDDQAIVGAPMASLFEVTKLRNIRSDPGARHHRPSGQPPEPDFITQGKISVEEAEKLFASFKGTLNAYLWGGIALLHDTLDAVRASSTILTASVLAVTALHTQDDGRAFDVCYPIFLELVSQAMFDRYHTLDDVRGLCIGAFWLSDVSWKLSGLAVRIATELNLHQYCAKALRDGTSYAEEARLWYFLYVCDHHFSIAYGRPPVISENPTITCHEHFLQRPDAKQSDLRLHSQVGIFIILSRVFHTFGPDRSRMIGSDEFETVRRFDADMVYWKDRWKTRLDPNEYISQYPAKGVYLHYHFARLLLFSICLRGIRPTAQYSMSQERRQFVNLAISSASSALELILNDNDMRRAVIGVPLYLLTTMAYAALFLMKCQSQWSSANLDITHDGVLHLIEGTVTLLEETKSCVRHVAHYIGRGLRGMLDKFKERTKTEQDLSAATALTNNNGAQGLAWPDENWPEWNSWMFGDAVGGYGWAPEYNFLGALNSQMPG